MKLSHGLKALLEPLFTAIEVWPCELMLALQKTGKRGTEGTYYPTDLRRVNLILETVHDVTGRKIETAVSNGDINSAIERLRTLWTEEDYLCELQSAFYVR